MPTLEDFYYYNTNPAASAGGSKEATTTSGGSLLRAFGGSSGTQLRAQLYRSGGAKPQQDRSSVERPRERAPAPTAPAGKNTKMSTSHLKEFFDYDDRPRAQQSRDMAPANSAVTIVDQQLLTEEDKARFAAQLSDLEKRASSGSPAGRQQPLEAPSAVAHGEIFGFYHRGEVWREKVRSDKDQLRYDLNAIAAKDCTFAPTINQKSRRMIESSRSTRRQQSVVSDEVQTPALLLFDAHMRGEERGTAAKQHHQPSAQISTEASSQAGEEVEEVGSRLHALNSSILAGRMNARMQQDEMLTKQCPFRPNVVRSPRLTGVSPRYLDGPERKPDPHTREFLDERAAECTFTPTTNRRVPPYVKNHYLATPVHQRLAQRPQHYADPTQFQSPHSSEERSARRRMSRNEVKSFYDRVVQNAIKKNKKIEAWKRMEEEMTPFKPTISAASRRILSDGTSQNNHAGGHDGKHPGNASYHTHCISESQPKHTFTPQINSRSRDLQHSWIEHQPEVIERKEARLARMSLEKQLLQEQELTFQPEISQYAQEQRSRLAEALVSKEQFQTYLSQSRAKRNTSLLPAQREKAQKEDAELTFHPTIHDAPEFIKTIAATLSLAKKSGDSRCKRVARDSSSQRGFSFSTEK